MVKAFTTIELILVVVIIGTLASIGIMKYNTYLEESVITLKRNAVKTLNSNYQQSIVSKEFEKIQIWQNTILPNENPTEQDIADYITLLNSNSDFISNESLKEALNILGNLTPNTGYITSNNGPTPETFEFVYNEGQYIGPLIIEPILPPLNEIDDIIVNNPPIKEENLHEGEWYEEIIKDSVKGPKINNRLDLAAKWNELMYAIVPPINIMEADYGSNQHLNSWIGWYRSLVNALPGSINGGLSGAHQIIGMTRSKFDEFIHVTNYDRVYVAQLYSQIQAVTWEHPIDPSVGVLRIEQKDGVLLMVLAEI